MRISDWSSDVCSSDLVADHAQPLVGGRPVPLSALAGKRVHAVAGIGDPERFFDTLRGHDIAVVPHAFADHHRYVAEDLRFGSDLPVLMTDRKSTRSELQSLMRISYAVFCLKTKQTKKNN